ncbi:hypothetical protein M0811_13147 [Anaeramoeba ignava]|uniref:Uncharacterized protein n=1 Tax=Anaeramoeba ignava TaxID=1746090 RepID=A0A9Q0L6D7_ANAIG|nr:hypothetical protein M0811_13147 [Anaeramoeba ignava]
MDNENTNYKKTFTKEKVLICLDLNKELREEIEGDKFSETLFQTAKNGIKMYVESKSRLSNVHEYALSIISEKPVILKGFSTDTNELVSFLDQLEPTEKFKKFDIMSICDLIKESTPIPTLPDPEFFVHVILIYGRPHVSLNLQNSFKVFLF